MITTTDGQGPQAGGAHSERSVFALNAANGPMGFAVRPRWYGTDVISEDDGAEQGHRLYTKSAANKGPSPTHVGSSYQATPAGIRGRGSEGPPGIEISQEGPAVGSARHKSGRRAFGRELAEPGSSSPAPPASLGYAPSGPGCCCATTGLAHRGSSFDPDSPVGLHRTPQASRMSVAGVRDHHDHGLRGLLRPPPSTPTTRYSGYRNLAWAEPPGDLSEEVSKGDKTFTPRAQRGIAPYTTPDGDGELTLPGRKPDVRPANVGHLMTNDRDPWTPDGQRGVSRAFRTRSIHPA